MSDCDLPDPSKVPPPRHADPAAVSVEYRKRFGRDLLPEAVSALLPLGMEPEAAAEALYSAGVLVWRNLAPYLRERGLHSAAHALGESVRWGTAPCRPLPPVPSRPAERPADGRALEGGNAFG